MHFWKLYCQLTLTLTTTAELLWTFTAQNYLDMDWKCSVLHTVHSRELVNAMVCTDKKSWSSSRAECIGKHTNRGRQEPNLEKRVGLGLAQINTHTKLENTSTQINTNVNTTHIFTQAPWRLQDFNDRLFGNLGSCEWPAILNNRFSWRDRIWWTLPRLLT